MFFPLKFNWGEHQFKVAFSDFTTVKVFEEVEKIENSTPFWSLCISGTVVYKNLALLLNFVIFFLHFR